MVVFVYVRDDLLQEVERLVEKGNIDYIVIESTGISNRYLWLKHSLILTKH